jgi:hypothetical protein
LPVAQAWGRNAKRTSVPVLITCMQCGRLAATTTGGPPGGRGEEPRSWKKNLHRIEKHTARSIEPLTPQTQKPRQQWS